MRRRSDDRSLARSELPQDFGAVERPPHGDDREQRAERLEARSEGQILGSNTFMLIIGGSANANPKGAKRRVPPIWLYYWLRFVTPAAILAVGT